MSEKLQKRDDAVWAKSVRGQNSGRCDMERK